MTLRSIVVPSGGGGAGAGSVNFSAGAQSANLGSVVFSNANNVSFGLNGSTITASANAAGGANINLSAGSTSQNLSAFTVAGANGITWGLDAAASVLTGSVQTAYQSQGAYLTTADLSQNSSNYARNWKLTGNSAGTQSSAIGTDLWLAGGNGVTVSGSSNSISFSVATNYQSQGAYLTTAMASNRGSDFVQATAAFAGTNASGTIASNGISVSVAAPGGGATRSVWFPPTPGGMSVANGAIQGQGTWIVWPQALDGNVVVSAANVFISLSVSTSNASSHAHTLSLGLGCYTRNASTLSLFTSGSTNFQFSELSGGSISVLSGVRMFSIPFSATLTPGDYWFAYGLRSSTTNANSITYSQIVYSGMNVAYQAALGSASNASNQIFPGWGFYTSTSASPPGAMNFNSIIGASAAASNFRLSVPVMNFVNYTA